MSQIDDAVDRKKFHDYYLCRKRKKYKKSSIDYKKRRKIIILTCLYQKLNPKLGYSLIFLSPGNRNISVELRWKSPVMLNVHRTAGEVWGAHSFTTVSNTRVMQPEAQSGFQPFNPPHCKHHTKQTHSYECISSPSTYRKLLLKPWFPW